MLRLAKMLLVSFTKHVYEKIKKSKQAYISIIRKLSACLPFKTLNQMYKTFVRSQLDYCDVIYHQAAKITREGQVLTTLMDEVERVQYRGALAVTGCWKGSNRSKLYDELGWESLSDRRKKQRLFCFIK